MNELFKKPKNKSKFTAHSLKFLLKDNNKIKNNFVNFKMHIKNNNNKKWPKLIYTKRFI